MSRTARIERETKESKVLVELDLDGSGRGQISTGVGFYDHMLNSLARHALVDLTVETVGDIHVDAHHTVEDTAIVLGQALREALGDKVGIRRFGAAISVGGAELVLHGHTHLNTEYSLMSRGR